MKNIVPFLLLLFITAPAIGQTSDETTETLLKDLIVDSFQEIFSDLDLEALNRYYTNDFLLLETGEVWDMDMMRDYMTGAKGQQGRPERVNSFDFVKIRVEDKMAWIAYFNEARFEKSGRVVGEMNWLESATAILTEDGWKLQLLHSTVVEDEEK